MKLPEGSLIPREKLVRYLLVPQVRGDKSGYLARGGFGQDNPDTLEQALRHLLLTAEARLIERNDFGELFEIAGVLRGPKGPPLPVRTIWITERLSRATKFVTLIPGTKKD